MYIMYPIIIIKANNQAIGLLNVSEFNPNRRSINWLESPKYQKIILLVKARDNPPSIQPVINKGRI